MVEHSSFSILWHSILVRVDVRLRFDLFPYELEFLCKNMVISKSCNLRVFRCLCQHVSMLQREAGQNLAIPWNLPELFPSLVASQWRSFDSYLQFMNFSRLFQVPYPLKYSSNDFNVWHCFIPEPSRGIRVGCHMQHKCLKRLRMRAQRSAKTVVFRAKLPRNKLSILTRQNFHSFQSQRDSVNA